MSRKPILRAKPPQTLWCAACKCEVKLAQKPQHEDATHQENVRILFGRKRIKAAVDKVLPPRR